eukprot:CAMPEP_0113908318 /NCGR_PEP_ID=MMETSP0780_2-20120614/26084_1 /TAXON_ID=652834 /ORGANISM="Palpitomonas bilix" /LENGTH=412 /DNA_ID=CAMNT_0000903711 /DNA_START=139 /DNA_END=1380 /DNA_ORIENTATION=- /assembly_acc=CAM_ASM_000599
MVFDADVVYATAKPKFIKKYILGETLGEGSFGKVREAIDSLTLKRCAAKIVPRKVLRKHKGGEKALQNEMQLMRKLAHNNVLAVLDYIDIPSKSKLYIMLEFAGGGTVQSLMEANEERKLPLPLARKYFRQLVKGLEHCHSKGVVHRDIKPGNLLIGTNDTLKIADFGSAEMLDKFDDSGLCQRSSGTPAFQAPEIAAAEESFSGEKVDVWAAGVSLYMMVTGKVPFDGDSLGTLFDNIAKGQFTIPDALPASLKDLISGMLRVNIEERLTLASVKNHKWLQETDGEKGLVGVDSSRPSTLLSMLSNMSGDELAQFIKEGEEDADEKDRTSLDGVRPAMYSTLPTTAVDTEGTAATESQGKEEGAIVRSASEKAEASSSAEGPSQAEGESGVTKKRSKGMRFGQTRQNCIIQ